MNESTDNLGVQDNSDKKGLSVAALVLGIVAVATGIFFYISLPTGILAIIFASIARARRYGNQSMALAGLITAIIGVAFGGIVLALYFIGIAASVHNSTFPTTY